MADYLIENRVIDLWRIRPEERAAQVRFIAALCRNRLDRLGVPAGEVSAYRLQVIAGNPMVSLEDAVGHNCLVQNLHRLMLMAVSFPSMDKGQQDQWTLTMHQVSRRIDYPVVRSYVQGNARRSKNHETGEMKERAAELKAAGRTWNEATKAMQREFDKSTSTVQRHMLAAGFASPGRGRPKN